MSCSICLDELTDPVSIPCGHVYCEKCLKMHTEANQGVPQKKVVFCPACRAPFLPSTCIPPNLPMRYRHLVLPQIRKVFFDPYTPDEKMKDMEKELKDSKEAQVLLEYINSNFNTYMGEQQAMWQQSEAAIEARYQGEVAARIDAQRRWHDAESRLHKEIHARDEAERRRQVAEANLLQEYHAHDATKAQCQAANDCYVREKSAHEETRNRERIAELQVQSLQNAVIRFEARLHAQQFKNPALLSLHSPEQNNIAAQYQPEQHYMWPTPPSMYQREPIKEVISAGEGASSSKSESFAYASVAEQSNAWTGGTSYYPWETAESNSNDAY